MTELTQEQIERRSKRTFAKLRKRLGPELDTVLANPDGMARLLSISDEEWQEAVDAEAPLLGAFQDLLSGLLPLGEPVEVSHVPAGDLVVGQPYGGEEAALGEQDDALEGGDVDDVPAALGESELQDPLALHVGNEGHRVGAGHALLQGRSFCVGFGWPNAPRVGLPQE